MNADGTVTTTRQTAGQIANQAAFDRQMGFTPTGEKPVYKRMQEADAARLQKDPYDLNYAEDTSGTFGSQQKVPLSVPESRRSGLAVRATGSSSALDTAGTRVAVNPGPAINQLTYKPAPEGPPSLPSTVYAAPNGAEATPFVPGPTATPGPGATTGLLPAPGASVTPTPTATPSATPTATPQIQVAAGRTTEAGVSNSQAAGFTQPTQANPLPQTPTSPVLDVNELDKRKEKFAGF